MKAIILFILVILAISISLNFYFTSEIKKMKLEDEKKTKVFSDVSDSLEILRMKRDSLNL